MSETTEPDGKPEPVPDTPAQPAPESTPPETDDPGPAREAEEAGEKEDRRTAGLRARLGAEQRERERAAQEAAYWRQQAQQYAPQQETPEQAARRIEAEADARAETRLLVRRFHEDGNAQYRDWPQKAQSLVEMGADSNIAMLLVEMHGGVRVAAALADDPTELQRIADIRSERGRAIELGKFAARIDNGEARPAAPERQQVTRAPAPIRPVTGRAAPTFNEYTADGNTLVDRYMKQAMDRQVRR